MKIFNLSVLLFSSSSSAIITRRLSFFFCFFAGVAAAVRPRSLPALSASTCTRGSRSASGENSLYRVQSHRPLIIGALISTWEMVKTVRIVLLISFTYSSEIIVVHSWKRRKNLAHVHNSPWLVASHSELDGRRLHLTSNTVIAIVLSIFFSLMTIYVHLDVRMFNEYVLKDVHMIIGL